MRQLTIVIDDRSAGCAALNLFICNTPKDVRASTTLLSLPTDKLTGTTMDRPFWNRLEQAIGQGRVKVKGEQARVIWHLHEQGTLIAAIARAVTLSRRTIYSVLDGSEGVPNGG